MVALQIKRFEGRQGQPQEFVEFQIPRARRSFIAQESGGWWLVFDNHHGLKAPCKTLQSFRPGCKQEAIACALAAAEAFVAAQGALA